MSVVRSCHSFFCFNDTATTQIYTYLHTLSLHDALPIYFPPTLAALVGYAQHRPNLGNVEGHCPSILLADQVPEHLSAIDALRPDQAQAADRKSTRLNSSH